MSKNISVGFAMCGSFCTLEKAISQMEDLTLKGYNITPVMSFNAHNTDTRFGTAQSFIERVEGICGKPIICSIEDAEPIGPKKMFDALVIAPATGNTIAKICFGITDTPVTMAAKAHIRGEKPVIIALSTNDALSGNASNIGTLLNRKNIYFVPFGQDDPVKKPRSMAADMTKIEDTIKAALERKQIQPILL